MSASAQRRSRDNASAARGGGAMSAHRPARGGAPMPRVTRHEDGRGEILRAAATLLATHGYHGMSMRDLSRSTNMSLANLYNYFGSKEELAFDLQIHALETLVASARETTAGAAGGEARLHAFILGHVRYVASHPEVMRVLVEEAGALPPERRRALREIKEQYFALGREIVGSVVQRSRSHAGSAAADPRELDRATYSIFGMLNWVYGWYDAARHGDAHEVARTIHRIAMSGLVARSPTRSSQAATERLVSRVRVRSPIRASRGRTR